MDHTLLPKKPPPNPQSHQLHLQLSLTTLPTEILLHIISHLPLPSLPNLHKTSPQFRALKPHLVTLIRQHHIKGHKICTACLLLRPHVDFPWHVPTHTSELCLRHADTWLCERNTCNLRYFAFKWNRMELELRLWGRWRALRGVKAGAELAVVEVEPSTGGTAVSWDSAGGASRWPEYRHSHSYLEGRRREGLQRREEEDRADNDFVTMSNRACRWSIASMIDEHLAELFMNTDFGRF